MKVSFSDFFILLGRLSIFVAAFVVPGLVAYWWLDSSFFSAADSNSTQVVSFEVARGTDLKRIAKSLEEKGLVRKWWSVYFIGRLKDYSRKINYGEYEFSPALTPTEILQKLVKGDILFRMLTVPEGANIHDVARLISETGLVTFEKAFSGLRDVALLSRERIPAATFEGYLFPETYKFTKPITVEEIVLRMVNEGRNRFSADTEILRRMEELRMTHHEILTLASIIEKETAAPEERATISSVFQNRLRTGMKLDSDPTVIYGIPNFNGNLTRKDLETPSEYNTYMFSGLPPGPICNPGMESIRAALFPAETEYLYFVGKGDGTHQFSSNIKEHINAVKKYQKKGQG